MVQFHIHNLNLIVDIQVIMLGGVFDFSENENSKTAIDIRKVYPEIGKSLYLDLASGTHIGLFEVPKKKINWIWYVNQPEPQLKVIAYSH